MNYLDYAAWLIVALIIVWNGYFGGMAVRLYLRDRRQWRSMVEVPGVVSFRQILGGPRDVVVRFRTAEGQEIDTVPNYRGDEFWITRYLREGEQVRVFHHPSRPDEPWLAQGKSTKWISLPWARSYISTILWGNLPFVSFLVGILLAR